MEYMIRLGTSPLDLDLLIQQLLELDPAMTLDRDRLSGDLRCATNALAHELIQALARAGYRLDSDDILRLPSHCCGGCSG